jgi:hypothetical protein
MSFKHVVASFLLVTAIFSAQAGCLDKCLFCCLFHCTSKYSGLWTSRKIADAVSNPSQDAHGWLKWHERHDEPPAGWPRGLKNKSEKMKREAKLVLDNSAYTTFSSSCARAKLDRWASHVIADLSSSDWSLRTRRSNTLKVCAHEPMIAHYLACWLAKECLLTRLNSWELLKLKDTHYILQLAYKFYSAARNGDA